MYVNDIENMLLYVCTENVTIFWYLELFKKYKFSHIYGEFSEIVFFVD